MFQNRGMINSTMADVDVKPFFKGAAAFILLKAALFLRSFYTIRQIVNLNGIFTEQLLTSGNALTLLTLSGWPTGGNIGLGWVFNEGFASGSNLFVSFLKSNILCWVLPAILSFTRSLKMQKSQTRMFMRKNKPIGFNWFAFAFYMCFPAAL